MGQGAGMRAFIAAILARKPVFGEIEEVKKNEQSSGYH
jgi:hypothetical protein